MPIALQRMAKGVDPMDLEYGGRPERGLHRYVGLVAEALGLRGEGWSMQLEPPVSVYLPVQERLARWPDRDVALLWDERHGWSVGVESPGGTEMTVTRYLGADVLPAPRVVAGFVERLFAGEETGQPEPPGLRRAGDRDDLPARLSAYARTPVRESMITVDVDHPDPVTVVLRVAGDLDMITAPQLDDSIALVLRPCPAVLVIDLSDVRFLGSAALSSLIRAHRVGAEGTEVHVVAPDAVTRWPLEVAGLTAVMSVHASVTAALDASRPRRTPSAG